MNLRFTPRALADIAGIADYIRTESPTAAEKVRGSILQSLQIIAEFPDLGRRQNIEGVRKHVTRKYGYLVYYTVDADSVVILTIQHPARDQPYGN